MLQLINYCKVGSLLKRIQQSTAFWQIVYVKKKFCFYRPSKKQRDWFITPIFQIHLLGLVIAILIPLSAAAEEFSGDYLNTYRRLADKGDKKAQYLIGLWYDQSDSGVANTRAALEWYVKAAAQDHRLASFRLGIIFQNGRGVKRNYKLAAEWYMQAADAGLSEAQFNLGYLYERGLGVKIDGARAVTWYRRAALQGETGAYRRLGMLYATGRLVELDDAKALFWLSLGEQDSNSKAIKSVIRKRSGLSAESGALKLHKEWNQRR